MAGAAIAIYTKTKLVDDLVSTMLRPVVWNFLVRNSVSLTMYPCVDIFSGLLCNTCSHAIKQQVAAPDAFQRLCGTVCIRWYFKSANVLSAKHSIANLNCLLLFHTTIPGSHGFRRGSNHRWSVPSHWGLRWYRSCVERFMPRIRR